MTDIDTAFEMLQEAVNAEINQANDEVTKALGLDDHSQAEKQMGRSKALADFKKRVLALQKDYKQISPSPIPRGAATPQKAFLEPIKTALKEMGGRGNAGEVVDRVGQIMGSKLENDIDQGKLKRGEPRWRSTCWRASRKLIKQGELKNDSPHGTWELA